MNSAALISVILRNLYQLNENGVYSNYHQFKYNQLFVDFLQSVRATILKSNFFLSKTMIELPIMHFNFIKKIMIQLIPRNF